MRILITSIIALIAWNIVAQTVTITIDATQGLKPISPWIYGRNNNGSDEPGKPISAALWKMYNDAGLKIYRENGGNNTSKYNWRLKLTSHPDWYNNVYSHDWDYCASSILSHTANTQVLLGFQLIGKAASNKNNNFDDWNYNGSNWWSGVTNNWAGGGGPVAGNGDPTKYLMNWTADSTVGIINQWAKVLHLDSTRFRYWNMDNEPEVWSGTHDDIINTSLTAEEYMQKYFAVAKAARKNFPGIKLVGPVSTNEWQWYNWNDSKVTDANDGKKYSWIEYFIKRIGEEQKTTGIRLLDVLDFHFYPNTENTPLLTLQLHRMWFDQQWVYPQANGVKRVGSSDWNSNVTNEYLFERCNQWLNQYLGTSHNVKFGLSEYGAIASSTTKAGVTACWYASHLGVFANNGVELFTPWDWYKGQWEVMHLFSKYYGQLAVGATSSQEDSVSGYSSVTSDRDSLIIAIVNRSLGKSRTVTINLQNFTPSATTVNGYQLYNLPDTESFKSATVNALQKKQYTISGTQLSLTVPELSVTLIQIPTNKPSAEINSTTDDISIFPNPAMDQLFVDIKQNENYNVTIYNMYGQKVDSWVCNEKCFLNISTLVKGNYIVQIKTNDHVVTKKFIKE